MRKICIFLLIVLSATAFADEPKQTKEEFLTQKKELILDERYKTPGTKTATDKSLIKKARDYFYKKEYDLAIECCKKVLEKEENGEAYYRIGYCYNKKKDWDKAIEWGEKAIKIDKGWAFRAYINVGNAYGNSGNYDKAIEYYQKSAELRPDSATAYGNLGWAYLQKKNYATCISYSKKAIELKHNLHWVYGNLGLAYERKGDIPEAKANYKKALELKPGYKWVDRRYKNLENIENFGEWRKNIFKWFLIIASAVFLVVVFIFWLVVRETGKQKKEGKSLQ